MNDDLKITAIHESGHCVKAFIDGCRLGDISIESGFWGEGEGETRITHPFYKRLHLIKSHQDLTLQSYINCLLAGPAAEMRATKNKTISPACREDLETAERILGAYGWRSKKAQYSPTEFFEEAGRAARWFASCYFSIIEPLADELVLKRKMSGRESVRFLHKIWPVDLPSGSLAYRKHRE